MADNFFTVANPRFASAYSTETVQKMLRLFSTTYAYLSPMLPYLSMKIHFSSPDSDMCGHLCSRRTNMAE